MGRLRLVGLTALAAAALTFVAVRRNAGPRSVELTAVRSADHPQQLDRSVSITAIAPVDRSTVDSLVAFRWRAVEPEATYRVTVQDETGAVAWETSVADTMVVVPQSVALVRGRQYFWTVDAALLDGSATTSGVHRFTIRP